jgi:hypothetical protein
MASESAFRGEPTVLGAVAYDSSQQCSPDMPMRVHKAGEGNGVRAIDDSCSGSLEAGPNSDYFTIENLDIRTDNLAECRIHREGCGIFDDGVSSGGQ